MPKYFIYFFLLANCFLLNCFSEETEDSIQKMVENKVYLKPGHVQIAKNGIFIHVEGELLPVTHLETDPEGVFFDLQTMKVEYCETCGLPMAWGKCLNPACPSKRSKKK